MTDLPPEHFEPGHGVPKPGGTRPFSEKTIWFLEMEVGEIRTANPEWDFGTVRWHAHDKLRFNRQFRVSKIGDDVIVVRLA